MAKNRMIRPETWTDEKFVSLDPLARLLFIGMWNYACDNGHLDDSALQLKMRVLPADSCDVAALLEDIINSGMITRENGYLKVVNLSDKQPLDLRFLVFCDHCDVDPKKHYQRSDKKGGTRGARGQHASDTSAAPEPPSGTRRSGDGDGDGDGDGKKPGSRRRSKHVLPEDWKPNTKHQEYANENGLTLSSEVLRFRSHALANDRRQVDWDAAFRMWLSRAVDYAPQRRPQPARPANVPEGW